MSGRFRRLTAEQYPEVSFGTFHSVFYNILRSSDPGPLRILRAEERNALIRHLLSVYGGSGNPQLGSACSGGSDSGGREKPLCGDADGSLFEAASDGIAAMRTDGQRLKIRSLAGRFPRPDALEQMCRAYEAFLAENGLVDFDGMILRCRSLLAEDPAIRRHWQSRFRHILVDEFQDINASQYDVLKLLSGCAEASCTGDSCRPAVSGLSHSDTGIRLAVSGPAEVFAVGDDDQSVYGFRGSDPALMQSLLRDLPQCEKLSLEVNYRCSAEIVRSSQALISENRDRFVKKVIAAHPGGSAPSILSFESAQEEYAQICRDLSVLYGAEADHTAVIFRAHSQSYAFLAELEKHGIPVFGNLRCENSERTELFRDLLSYYVFASEEDTRTKGQRSDLYRIMNLPQRYISRDAAKEETVSCADLCRYYRNSPVMCRTVRALHADLQCLLKLRPALSLRYLRLSMGLQSALCAGKKPVSVKRTEQSFAEAEKAAAGMSGPAELMRWLGEALADDGNEKKRGGGTVGRSSSGVRVLTMHASKGLEFDRVYIPDLNDGILPGRRFRDAGGIEEERRLLYVAMTRAREKLTLLWVSGTRENPGTPSRFLRPFGIRPETRE
jgi:DNA helicase-2/ATP-dependent DNA helicase PcrA